MKRLLSAVLILIMAVLMLTGCGTRNNDLTNGENTLTILMPYGTMTPLLEAMKEEFPEISFEIEYYMGDNTSGYLSERIINGDAGDLIYYSVLTSLEEYTSQFYDLSGTTVTKTMKESILRMVDVNGSIYQIPGPLDVRGVSYNKTMFAEYGWEMPNNFDELIELVKQIRTDAPEIVPIASAGQDAYYFSIPASIAQAGFLSTSEGYHWEQDFFNGEASIKEGFSEGLEGMIRLIEAGAFDGEKCAGKWHCDDFLVNREAAMNIQWAGMKQLITQIETSETTDEFGIMPFYGVNGSDRVLVYNSTGNWGVNKKLEDKGNEKKLENALKVMEWLTKEEAQEILRTNDAQLSVTATEVPIDARIVELLELSKNGVESPMIYTGYEHILVEAGNVVKQAATSGETGNMIEDFIKISDELNYQYTENKDTPLYGAYLKEDLNTEQTAQLVADALMETGKGDFALVTHTGQKNNVANRYGAAGTLYAGGIILPDIMTINSSRSMRVATLELTGAQVRTLLEQGKGMYEGEADALHLGQPYADNAEELPTEYFEYYWSGIDVVMKNGKVTSMNLNGKELNDTETYTVIFEQNDYPRSYMDKAVITDLLTQDAFISYFEGKKELYAPEELRK